MDEGRLEWAVTNTAKRNSDLPLNQRNIHPRDLAIHFDEPSHIYLVNGKKAQISVTGLKELFIHPFDENEVLKDIYEKTMKMPHAIQMEKEKKLHLLKVEDPKSKYHGQIRPEVLKFNGAASLGTKMHDRIDRFLSSKKEDVKEYNCTHEEFCAKFMEEQDTEEEKIIFEQFVAIIRDFYKAGWRPYRTEWRIWLQQGEDIIAGSIDCVLERVGMDQVKEYCVVDWKRTPKTMTYVFPKKPRFMPYPLDSYPNCKLNEYGFQTEVYRRMLILYGMNVTSSFIVQLKPAKTRRAFAECYPIPDMQDDVQKCIDIYFRTQELMRAFNAWDRKNIVKNKGNDWVAIPTQSHPLFFEDAEEYERDFKKRRVSEDEEG